MTTARTDKFTRDADGVIHCAVCARRLPSPRSARIHYGIKHKAIPAVSPTVNQKANHVGAPAIFALGIACQHINAAFGDYGCFLVGSCLTTLDWHDIDVRFVMPDAAFNRLFPDIPIGGFGAWEQDPRWLLLTVSISTWLHQQTGLPVDFQMQPATYANERYPGPRQALGATTPTVLRSKDYQDA